MQEQLLQQLAARGYRARIVSIDHLRDLQEAIAGFYRQGAFDEQFYRDCVSWINSDLPKEMPEARSLIVAAYQDVLERFYFHWQGKRIAATVPHTYLHWREKHGRAEAAVSEVLGAAGYRALSFIVPAKRLAVCSGLARYGRNNITFVQGFGSSHRLATFCSDFPCEEDPWREPQALARCEGCTRCAQACPTGAIDPERFLLHGERCLTYWNEKDSSVPFPEWMEDAWHHTLVGCMRCQRACPENRGMLERCEEGCEFSEEETALLLQGTPREELPAALAEKMERNDLFGLYDSMPRNLGKLVGTRGN